MSNSDTWTPAAVAHLRAEFAKGVSGALIAESLHAELGILVSRNAIMGKLNRLGIKRGDAPVTLSRTPRPRKPKNAIDAKIADIREQLSVAPKSEPQFRCVGLLDLTHDMCRYPHGDPGQEGFGFCGEQTFAGTSWCPFHFRITHVRTAA